MSPNPVVTLLLCALNGAIVLLLAPLVEGVMRKLKALVHSRVGPPIIQPYLDLLKLLGKEDLRTSSGWLYGAAPALTLASVLLLGMIVPMGGISPLGAGADIIVLAYVATMSALLVMLTAFGSASPYASVGSSRELMLLISVEPVLVISLVVGATNAGSLTLKSIVDAQLGNGPSLSMVIAGIAFFLALQAQAGKLPFDVPEAEQELMGGPLIEQSGPRLALFRWALWAKQLVFAFLLVEVFVPWPGIGIYPISLLLGFVKVLVILVLVALVDVVNPRLRIDQAMAYYMRVGLVSLAALAFAVIGT